MPRLPKKLSTKLLEDRLLGWLYSRQSDQKYTYDQYEMMLRLDPVTAVANESLKQGIISMIGEYTHEDSEEITQYVRDNFVFMSDVLESFWKMALSYISHGASVHHMKHVLRDKQAWIDIITTIPLEWITWEYEGRQISSIKVAGVSDSVDYSHVFHLVNEPDLQPGKLNPWGNAACARAYKYWELEELLFTTVGTIGQKQSAKLLVGKIPDTDAEIELDEVDTITGQKKKTTSGQQMKEVLESTENQSVIVAEIGDEIEAIDQTIKGDFFDFIFHDLRTQRFLAFYQSQTTFSGNKSGVGDAGLAESQKETLLNFQEAKAVQLTQEFINQELRLLIDHRFGVQKSYGSFAILRQDPKALEIAGLVLQMLTSGILGGGQDAEGKTKAVNKKEWEQAYQRLKDLVGIS